MLVLYKNILGNSFTFLIKNFTKIPLNIYFLGLNFNNILFLTFCIYNTVFFLIKCYFSSLNFIYLHKFFIHSTFYYKQPTLEAFEFLEIYRIS